MNGKRKRASPLPTLALRAIMNGAIMQEMPIHRQKTPVVIICATSNVLAFFCLREGADGARV